MNNNIFHIDVVPEIPDIQRPGTIYVNGIKYASQMPEELPETFLIAGEHLGSRYLEEGANKDVVASVSMIHSVDSNKIFVVIGHPGYKFPIPDDVTRYYLDSTTNNLYTAIGNPRVNGYRKIDGPDIDSSDDLPLVVYNDETAIPLIYIYADGEDISDEKVMFYSLDGSDEGEDQYVMYNGGKYDPDKLPIVYVYTSYTVGDGALIDNVKVLWKDIVEGEEDDNDTENVNDYSPSTVITVSSLEELYRQTPNFLGVYKVLSGDEPTFYIYNPYNLVEQEYFNFNCDVFY